MLNKPTVQSGFTLVEMLVAVVVLSIGLLGLAGLQAQSISFNKSAADRSQATILAYDMIDRMRANRTLAEAGLYNTDFATPASSSNCETSTCGAEALAGYDITQWQCLLDVSASDYNACTNLGISRGALLEGRGSVSIAGGVVTVIIRWTDDRGEKDEVAGATEELDVSTVL